MHEQVGIARACPGGGAVVVVKKQACRQKCRSNETAATLLLLKDSCAALHQETTLHKAMVLTWLHIDGAACFWRTGSGESHSLIRSRCAWVSETTSSDPDLGGSTVAPSGQDRSLTFVQERLLSQHQLVL